jgi:hypothetical protein
VILYHPFSIFFFFQLHQIYILCSSAWKCTAYNTRYFGAWRRTGEWRYSFTHS